MGTQTWHIAIQLSSGGHHRWTLHRSDYRDRGRQHCVPLAHGVFETEGELHAEMSTLSDVIGQAVRYDPHALQPQLPF
jgi:hypothetical protein